MSQVADPIRSLENEQASDVESSNTQSAANPRPLDPDFRAFEYTPVPIIAPISLVLGICSATGLLGLFGLFLCLAGIVVGLVAVWKIRRAEGTLGGRKLATAGLTLSALFFVSGSSWQAYAYSTEVPEGYERISFTHGIAKKDFIMTTQGMTVHPDVEALHEKPIFLKGYMYPTRQTKGLRQFVLVEDNGQCCFGGEPDVTDMILVEMQDGKTVDYYSGLVSLAGVFRLNNTKQEAGLSPVYLLEGHQFEPSRTSF